MFIRNGPDLRQRAITRLVFPRMPVPLRLFIIVLKTLLLRQGNKKSL